MIISKERERKLMSCSLYAKYINEREGLEEIKRKWGFLHYRIDGEECFISDYFVAEPFRGSGLGYDMADEAEEIAKEKDCKYMTCQVDMHAFNPEQSLCAIIKHGYKIINIENNRTIKLYKELI